MYTFIQPFYAPSPWDLASYFTNSVLSSYCLTNLPLFTGSLSPLPTQLPPASQLTESQAEHFNDKFYWMQQQQMPDKSHKSPPHTGLFFYTFHHFLWYLLLQFFTFFMCELDFEQPTVTHHLTVLITLCREGYAQHWFCSHWTTYLQFPSYCTSPGLLNMLPPNPTSHCSFTVFKVKLFHLFLILFSAASSSWCQFLHYWPTGRHTNIAVNPPESPRVRYAATVW